MKLAGHSACAWLQAAATLFILMQIVPIVARFY
jgi:hypothetical protein